MDCVSCLLKVVVYTGSVRVGKIEMNCGSLPSKCMFEEGCGELDEMSIMGDIWSFLD